jgi:catalase
MTVTPTDAVDAANAAFGRHPGHRALHAKGILLKGTFTAEPEVRTLTKAGHLQGEPVEVTVRFSNGSGDPQAPDYLPDVRGMAVKFYLPDGTRTDVVAQTAPHFPVRTPEAFVGLLRAAAGGPRALLTLPVYLARNPRAALRFVRNQRTVGPPPVSFATLRYFAVHAFRFVSPTGAISHVRYELEPAAGVHRLDPVRAARRGRDYLFDDVRRRLADGPIEFRLQLQIASPEDPVDDPSIDWPATRPRMTAGRLELTALEEGRERDGDVLVFDPTRVVEGIELTNDPVLRFRAPAYGESVARRTTGS